MAIKRLYQKLTEEHNDFGFDSDTRKERRRDVEAKGQRLQFIVYSALFAFIILAAYGYFLIYNLTHDVHSMSRQMTQMSLTFQRMTSSVESNMDIIALNIQSMTRTVGTSLPSMSHDTSKLDKNTREMARTFLLLNKEISLMSTNLTFMTNATVNMQRDLWSMNKNVSDPMGTMMGNMIPWAGAKKAVGSPGPLPYGALPAHQPSFIR
jgi:hypothetical protein